MKKRQGYTIRMSKLERKRLKNNQCPSCGKPKSEWDRRTDWRCCCIKCTTKFEKNLRLFWSDIRLKAFKRDNFTCVKCGYKGVDSTLIGDHIIPIALEGDEWDLENVQTLCIKCNKIKNAKDAKKIAKERRKGKIFMIEEERRMKPLREAIRKL